MCAGTFPGFLYALSVVLPGLYFEVIGMDVAKSSNFEIVGRRVLREYS